VDHAYECLEPCVNCAGTGSVTVTKKGRRGKKGKRPKIQVRVDCKACEGRGACGFEWRTASTGPLQAPCRRDDCCVCTGKNPCDDELQLCTSCYYYDRATETLHVNQPPRAWACPRGSCPKCGGVYVEWLSFKVEPVDVYLNREAFGPKATRTLPSSVTIRERSGR
jgi:hypothetical protein